MSRLDWQWRFKTWLDLARGRNKILLLLLGLLIIGLGSDTWQAIRRLWRELHRPVAVYHRAIKHGVAISLNALEREQKMGSQLPPLDLRGVFIDRTQNDWILFGEADPKGPPFPVDAVAVALRAIRSHLEAPGVDIRPRPSTGDQRHAEQGVTYFGGVGGTVVGMWFFRFDYWMKRVSLAEESVPVAGVPIYWKRAVEALEHEVKTCDGTKTGEWVRGNRYWLCAGEFTAVEENDTLAFQDTPLRVLAENISSLKQKGNQSYSPCSSQGTDDPLAAEFANFLSKHLIQFTQVTPVAEIESFSRLMAGFSWLIQIDPYRDLRPWLNRTAVPVETPTTVPSLSKKDRRQHTIAARNEYIVHEHRLEVSGGVLIAPRLVPARVGDDSLLLLHRAVLRARPAGSPGIWSFIYRPPSNSN